MGHELVDLNGNRFSLDLFCLPVNGWLEDYSRWIDPFPIRGYGECMDVDAKVPSNEEINTCFNLFIFRPAKMILLENILHFVLFTIKFSRIKSQRLNERQHMIIILRDDYK